MCLSRETGRSKPHVTGRCTTIWTSTTPRGISKTRFEPRYKPPWTCTFAATSRLVHMSLAPHTYSHAQATTEDSPVPFELDSPYQISKVVGEFYSVYYHHQHKLPTVRARFQNVYGPGEILGEVAGGGRLQRYGEM
jgi:NAD dependent epimerase/dehydratase family